MTPRPRALPGALLLVLALLGAGCTRPSPESRSNAAERAACRQHAEEVYKMRNRDEVYRADTYATSTRDAPFAAGSAHLPTAGLSGAYQREQMYDDCLYGGDGTVGAAPDAPPPQDTTGKP